MYHAGAVELLTVVVMLQEALITWDYPAVLAVTDLSFKGLNNDFKLPSSKHEAQKYQFDSKCRAKTSTVVIISLE